MGHFGPFDPSVLLKYAPPQQPQPSFAESYKFGITLRDLADRRRIQELQLRQHQLAYEQALKDRADEEALQQSIAALGPNPTVDQIIAAPGRLKLKIPLITNLRQMAEAGSREKTAELTREKTQAELDAERLKQQREAKERTSGEIFSTIGAPVPAEKPHYEGQDPAELEAQARQVRAMGIVPEGTVAPTLAEAKQRWLTAIGPEKAQTYLEKVQQERRANEPDTSVKLARISVDPNEPEERRTLAKNALEALQGPQNAAQLMSKTNQLVQAEGKLRDDYTRDPDVKGYITRRDAYQQIKGAMQSQGGISDLSLIFGYMKVLDPNSTVREGEAASVGQAAGVSAAILNLYNRVVKGEKLPPSIRQDIVRETEKIYANAEANQGKKREQYRRIAESHGIDPQNVIIDYSPVIPAAADAGTASAAAPAGAPTAAQPVIPLGQVLKLKVGEVLNGHAFLGGDLGDQKRWRPLNDREKAALSDEQKKDIAGGKKPWEYFRQAQKVKMRAPNGQVAEVPADQVKHYESRGATRLN